VELECVFFGPLRDVVGQKTVRYETDAETAGELLGDLQESYPELGTLVEDGELAGGIVVTHNHKHLRHRNGLETPLNDGDTVRLTPTIKGG